MKAGLFFLLLFSSALESMTKIATGAGHAVKQSHSDLANSNENKAGDSSGLFTTISGLELQGLTQRQELTHPSFLTSNTYSLAERKIFVLCSQHFGSKNKVEPTAEYKSQNITYLLH